MSRPAHTHPLARWSLPLAVGALAVLSVLPLRWLNWSKWFAEQTRVVIAPISHPITRATDLVIPYARGGPGGTETERTLRDELERVRVRLLQSETRVTELEGLVGAGLDAGDLADDQHLGVARPLFVEQADGLADLHLVRPAALGRRDLADHGAVAGGFEHAGRPAAGHLIKDGHADDA